MLSITEFVDSRLLALLCEFILRETAAVLQGRLPEERDIEAIKVTASYLLHT
jgi:hypothetical protein